MLNCKLLLGSMHYEGNMIKLVFRYHCVQNTVQNCWLKFDLVFQGIFCCSSLTEYTTMKVPWLISTLYKVIFSMMWIIGFCDFKRRLYIGDLLYTIFWCVFTVRSSSQLHVFPTFEMFMNLIKCFNYYWCGYESQNWLVSEIGCDSNDGKFLRHS